jgi:outer membrane protein assembly factor BamA
VIKALTVVFCLLPGASAYAQSAPGEVVAELRVHGNQIATNDEVIALSGVTIGSPVTATTVAEVTKRLRDSKKFDDVQVLKRFASISDPTQIVLVIIVSEGPVKIEVPKKDGDPVRVVKKGGISNLMWFPLLDGEDGYGFTYGAKLALVNVGGPDGKVSFPLTWGGTKQAAAEYERTFKQGPFSRIQFGGGIKSSKNPAYEIDDERRHVDVRAERAVGPLRLGAEGSLQHVSFDTDEDDFRSIGADVEFDTRADPLLPRNAVYAIASWRHFTYGSPPSQPGIASVINRTRLEGHGYIGLVGQSVLELRAIREDADRPLPRYMQSLLGGWRTLRGFEAGSFFGDTMVTGSMELRIPVTSALSVAKLGVSAFGDYGTVYPKGQQFRDATFRTGFGGSVWLTAAVFQMSLAVAHGLGAGTRVNFMVGLTF